MKREKIQIDQPKQTDAFPRWGHIYMMEWRWRRWIEISLWGMTIRETEKGEKLKKMIIMNRR